MDKTNEEYLKEADAIVADADALQSEHEKLVDALADCDVAKASAKSLYERGLDAGDESLMKGALRSIREANSKAERIKKTMGGFAERLVTLRQQHDALKDEIRPLRDQAENAVRIAKERADELNRIVNRIYGLQANLNNLADTIGAPAE
ncbi:MAG: hypothetical protein A2Z25_12035 [Planctomycetes bacterium RBG_16_55_9]|nr:MAG: hypothetical protein A2Z25_12035 [Planctomycetes bacterium RBG_16_55_9]